MKTLFEKFKTILLGWGPLGMFVICLVDGAGLPNPSGPDILLLIFSAADPSRAFLGAALGVVGSILGNYILYSIARKGGEIYLAKHTEGARGRKFREWFDHYGQVTVFVPALVPIPMPLKAFVICSGALRVNPAHFLSVLGVARTIRYTSLAWLGRTLGKRSLAWFSAHRWHFIGGALALIAALFLLIWAAERRRLSRRDKLAA
jgi:membrane protein YqaA with SNARE-associated domain